MSQSDKIQIRYNTQSTDDSNSWRLIENGTEQLVSNVVIDGNVFTTKDWMKDIHNYKWHISCIGKVEIKNNIAYITTQKEKSVLIRHILKTISYRILGTLTTVITAFMLGATIEISTLLGIAELIIKPLVYFLHERVWYKKIRINKNYEK